MKVKIITTLQSDSGGLAGAVRFVFSSILLWKWVATVVAAHQPREHPVPKSQATRIILYLKYIVDPVSEIQD